MPLRGSKQKECAEEWNILDVSSSTTVLDLSAHSSGCSSDVSSLCFGPVDVDPASDIVVTIKEEGASSSHRAMANSSSSSAPSSRPSSADSYSSSQIESAGCLSSAHDSSQSQDEDPDATAPPPPEAEGTSGPAVGGDKRRPKRGARGPPPARKTRSAVKAREERVAQPTLEELPEEEPEDFQTVVTRSQKARRGPAPMEDEAKTTVPKKTARAKRAVAARETKADRQLREAMTELKLAKDRRRTFVIKIGVNVAKQEQQQEQGEQQLPQQQMLQQQLPEQQMLQQQLPQQQMVLQQEPPQLPEDQPQEPPQLFLPPPSYSMLSVHHEAEEGPASQGLPEKKDLSATKSEEKKRQKEKKKKKDKKKRKKHRKSSSSSDDSFSSSSQDSSSSDSSEGCSCSDCQSSGGSSSCSCTSCQDESSCSCSDCYDSPERGKTRNKSHRK